MIQHDLDTYFWIFETHGSHKETFYKKSRYNLG